MVLCCVGVVYCNHDAGEGRIQEAVQGCVGPEGEAVWLLCLMSVLCYVCSLTRFGGLIHSSSPGWLSSIIIGELGNRERVDRNDRGSPLLQVRQS